jgi:hypothetical protein
MQFFERVITLSAHSRRRYINCKEENMHKIALITNNQKSSSALKSTIMGSRSIFCGGL